MKSCSNNPLHRGLLPLLACAVLLHACGGGDTTLPRSTAEAAPAERRSVMAAPPLLDNDSQAMPSAPAAEPADPGARTRQGLYATNAQAEQALDVFGNGAVRVEVSCCGADAVQLAIDVVQAVRSLHQLEADAPVFVYGRDLRLAAAAVNRLGDEGFKKVWLVTR
jgi:hypothetical protein